MCAVPNMAVFSSPLIACFHGMLLRYCLSNCNCNLFAVHKSKLGYSPVDIDFVTYMPSNIIYT